LWIRETVQNSVDAIKSYSWENRDVDIDFSQNNWHFVSTIKDPVWMNSKEVFKYTKNVLKSESINF
jgi:hypothetical protein